MTHLEELDHESGQALAEREEQEEKKTQSQVLVGLASDMELFYDEQGTSYAKMLVRDHYEVWPIRSEDFRLILTARYLNITKDKAPGGQAMADALNALEALARINGKKQKIHVRVAETFEHIYLDLCNEKWQAIKIGHNGWEVVNNPPVYFKRSKIMRPLPTPTPGGNIEELKRFVNYESEDDFKLIIAWIISTFRENSPFPILTIQGEQGSAKSTVSRVLRNLVDPSSLPLRALPREERDLSIGANNTWVLAFDNLSGLSNQMSDSLCKLSTGGGLATRKLYSDDEEAVFNIMRPSILNGIDDIARRQDLLDRSIVINLPSISEDKRTDEKTFWKLFREKKPYILGALCDVVSNALKRLPNIKLNSKPRMADFALWITAAENALNWKQGEFIAIYTNNRSQAVDQGLESDPFASAVMQLLDEEKTFIGNASQLLGEAGRYTDERTRKTKAWPTSRSVRNRLKRINPALRSKGILYVEYESKKHRTLKLEMLSKTSSLSSPTSPTPSDQHSYGYDNGYDNGKGYDTSSPSYDNGETSSPYKDRHINIGADGYDNDDNMRQLSKNKEMDLII